MVVKTRSYQKKQREQHYQEDVASFNENIKDTDIHITASDGYNSGSRRRRVTIVTPSFVEASTHTYKVYSPINKPENINNKKKKGIRRQNKTSASASAEVLDAAETLASLLEYDDSADSADSADMCVSETSSSTEDDTQSNAKTKPRTHKCINPMTPVSKYIYRIGIYNISQTQHYKTAYILYDTKSRMFHVYTIISNQVPDEEETATGSEPEGSATDMAFSLPLPKNTIQTKYTTYINETVSNYVMTMIIPSNEHDYYIQDDILGVVISNDEYREKAFSEDTSFYDIEDIIFDDTSSETTNGYKAFMLIPSRNFWFSPVGAYYALTDANTIAYRDHNYTRDTVESVLMILSQST